MLLATLLVLALLAAIFAVTQIGALITVLFVIAVLVLAYKRLPLLAFSVVFTVLFIVYSWFGDPSGLWAVQDSCRDPALGNDLCDAQFASLNRFAHAAHHVSTEREALEAGTVWWDGSCSPASLTGTSCCRLIRPGAEKQAFLDGPCELCAMAFI
jgi:hypothetical protein